MQPLLEPFPAGVLPDYVKLGAITGGKQNRFIEPIQRHQVLERT